MGNYDKRIANMLLDLKTANEHHKAVIKFGQNNAAFTNSVDTLLKRMETSTKSARAILRGYRVEWEVAIKQLDKQRRLDLQKHGDVESTAASGGKKTFQVKCASATSNATSEEFGDGNSPVRPASWHSAFLMCTSTPDS